MQPVGVLTAAIAVGPLFVAAKFHWPPAIRCSLITVGAASGIIHVLLYRRGERSRSASIATWAAVLGWTFVPNPDPDHGRELPQFPVFQHGGRAFNVVRGITTIAGRHFTLKCGDYYSNATPGIKRTRLLSYFILTLPVPNCPCLEVRGAAPLDAAVAALGLPDINFESEEFSRRFSVASNDPRFASAVISPLMMEFLLASPLPRTIVINRGQACITSWDSLVARRVQRGLPLDSQVL